MNEDKIKRQISDMVQSIDEVIASTSAIKGAAFAGAVGILFESRQLSELIGQIAELAKDGNQNGDEAVESLSSAAVMILGNVVTSSVDFLDEKDFNEALQLSDSLYARRCQTIESINQSIRDD